MNGGARAAVLLVVLGTACGDQAARPGAGLSPAKPMREPGGEPADVTPGAQDAAATVEPLGEAAGAVGAEASAVTAEQLLAHVAALPTERHVGSAGHAATRAVLRERLESVGYTVEEQAFTWDGTPGVALVNLEVRVPAEAVIGGAPAEGARQADVLVLCAHYDAVRGSPGADDNGSGCAVLLELARRLHGRNLPVELRFVWFDAEEPGLAGSRAWINALDAAARARMLAAVNLETLGYTDRRPGSQSMPPGSRLLLDPGDVGDFLLVLGNQSSAAVAEAVRLGLAAEQGQAFRAEVFSQLPGVGWLMPDSRRSDHASFWDAGIPALMLTDTADFRNPNYHRPTDALATLDGDFLAALTRGLERAVLLLAEDAADGRIDG